jgi:hypothetical protein
VIFTAPASHRDPAEKFHLHSEGSNTPTATASGAVPTRNWADYAYAHGGKDGTPFPVDRTTYDRNIGILIDAVRKAKIGDNDKMHALRRLSGSEPGL